jgi:Protein of unknown function
MKDIPEKVAARMTGGAERETTTTAPPSRPMGRGNRHIGRLRRILRYAAILFLIAVIGVFGVLALGGRTIGLPVWAVAEVESRLNKAMAGQAPLALSVGGIAVAVDRDWVPRLQLTDLRLAKPDGTTFLTLPEARIVLAPGALLHGQVQPRSVTLVGAKASLRRDSEGRFDFDFGEGTGARADSFAALLDAGDAVFSLPALASLTRIDAEAMTLTLADARTGRTWDVGDGHLTLENRPSEVAAELGMTLVAGGAAPSQATLTMVSQKTGPEARIAATVDHIAASDLAAQAAPLAFLAVLDAPISGQLTTVIGADGRVATLDGRLSIGAGALLPTPESKPVSFDRAGLYLTYDGAAERLALNEITVEGRSIRVTAKGQVLMPGVGKGIPTAFLTQISFDEVMIDPEGLFVEPIRFSDGALDLRLKLNPFVLDIGQLALVEEGRRLRAKGRVAADAAGWDVAIDLGLNEITHQKMMALWPVGLVPRTRDWLVDNVQESLLFDVKAALRVKPRQPPRLALSYEFAGTDVRFIKTLPPIRDGKGYATIEGNTFTMVLDRGRVTPPLGGDVNMAGSIFTVLDITQRPAQAEIRLKADSSLTAALSLLDEKPFEFLTKAGRPVTLGQGRAVSEALLRMPLVPKVPLKDIRYEVTGTLYDLSSDILVPGHVVTADRLSLAADPSGMTITGPGRIGDVPFDGSYAQGFLPKDKGIARVEGTAELSPGAVKEFNLGLPDGMVSGKGQGEITINLVKGQPPRLSLTSDLKGLGLALPELSWTKPKTTAGKLTVAAALGSPAKVEKVTLDASGLSLTGSVTMRAKGGLDEARFDHLRLDDWLDTAVVLTGQGAGRTPAIALKGGSLDTRKMSFGSRGGGAGESGDLPVSLDKLIVSDSITLTDFNGKFRRNGGFRGNFTALVNGKASIAGSLAQVDGGTGVRILSDDAGAVLAAAGIFADARGGGLEMQMVPAGPDGHYNGVATATGLRVRNAPVLAELLNAISVIGILEQMNGTGLLFNNAEAVFRLTPDAIEVTRASAIGASIGVSMAGLYETGSRRLRMQGVISPIYIVNGIGALFSKKGEGLFGFNYKLRGTADDPQVTVNPLSILTPGMFREIFRRPPPVLPPTDGNG